MSVESDHESFWPPEQRAGFATTHWSVVLEAGHQSSPDSDQALASLCETYWYPLYVYARRRGALAADARDSTQSFFTHLLEKRGLRVADPDRGRFRSFLLTMFRHFLADEYDRANTQRRGGGVTHLSIDFDSGERRYQFEPTDDWTPEKVYERRWALTLLDQVIEGLQQEYCASGKRDLFDHCKGHLTGSGSAYSEIAQALAMTEGAIRVSVHRMRVRYRELLKQAVAATLADPAAVDDELAHLRSALRGGSG